MEINTIIDKKLKRIIIFSILIFTFILYGNSIRNEYAVDDEMVTLNNPRVEKGIEGIPEIFTTHHAQEGKQSYDYRPIVLVTYALEYQFFGRNPHISHFINVLLYALTCILLFFVLFKMLRGYHFVFPVLITFLFIAHPLHTEVVNNLKSRDELLCFLFSLVAVYLYLKYADSGKIKYVLFGMLCLIIATLSKLTAIIFVFIIPLAIFFFRKTNWKRILLSVLSIFIARFLFGLIRKLLLTAPVVREFLYFENPLFYEGTFLDRIPAAFYTLAFYLRLLVFPHPLSFYYGYDQVPIAGWSNVISWLSIAFFIGIGIYSLVKLPKKNVLVFGIIFYLIAIAGFSNLITPVVGIIGERFAYIASLGFCWVLAYFLLKVFKIPFETNRKIFKINTAFVVTLVLIFGFYSIRTIYRNHDWKDNLTLYRHDVKHLQKSVIANALLADNVLLQLLKMHAGRERERLVNEAIKHYKKALKIYPYYSNSLNQLGSIYFMFKKDYHTAKPYFEKAIEADPNSVEAHFNLGFSCEKLGNIDNAIFYYEKALELNKKYYLTYPRLSNLYLDRNKVNKAIELNLKGILHFPRAEKLYINLGNAYSLLDDMPNVLRYFEYAAELNPGNYELLVHIARQYDKLGNKSKAAEYWDKAQKVKEDG